MVQAAMYRVVKKEQMMEESNDGNASIAALFSEGCVILRAPPEYPSHKITTPSNVNIAHVATTLGSSIGGNHIDTSAPTHSYTSNDRYIHSQGPTSNILIVQMSLTHGTNHASKYAINNNDAPDSSRGEAQTDPLAKDDEEKKVKDNKVKGEQKQESKSEAMDVDDDKEKEVADAKEEE
nr:hypothetical protein [Tanacetum cinerariifolium]